MAGFNPNRKKKTYSYNRSQASRIVATVVDGKVEYFDETLTAVDNPFYVIQQAVSQGLAPPVPPPPINAFYDEDVVDFDWTDSEPATFNISFPSTPYLTLEVLPAEGFENIAFFASNLSAGGFTANVSAPFSGQLVYRALVTPTFPVIIERKIVSASFYYTASAGILPASSNDTFTATYTAVGVNPPEHIFFTPVDDNNNGDAGVALEETGSMGATSTTLTYSAPVYNSIHYLVVKS